MSTGFSTWIVELPNDGRQSVVALRMEVREGHLVALDHWQDQQIAAWAPGQWARFWARPTDDEVERQRGYLLICERAIAEATSDEDRRLLQMRIDQVREQLYQAIDQNRSDDA